MSGSYRHIPLTPQGNPRRPRRILRALVAHTRPIMAAVWVGLFFLAVSALGAVGLFMWLAALCGYVQQRRVAQREAADPQGPLPYDGL